MKRQVANPTPRYNTRLSARKLAEELAKNSASFVAGEAPPLAPGEAARVVVGTGLGTLVRGAVAREQARADEDDDDTEGQELSFTPCPSRCASPASSRSSTPAPEDDNTSASATSSTPLKGGSTGRRRRKRQALAKAATDPREYKIRSSLSLKYKDVENLKTQFNVKTLPAARGADIGLRRPIIPVSPALDTLLNDGFKLVKWDGRTPKSLVDTSGKSFVHLAGRPTNDSTYDAAVQGAEQAISAAREQLHFGAKQLSDRRGPFPTFAYGISYGGGQKQPGNLKHSEHNRRVLKRLHANRHVVRLMKYANSVVAFHFPKLYCQYADNMAALLAEHPHLRPVLPGGIYAATSTNFGPNVVSYEHEDFGNKANGVCPIFSFGNFDPRYGGHLVLRQLKLVIEFPPGSLIIVPSATLTHGNTPIQPHEHRLSFTQYAAGGLFRWVRYGFRTRAQLEKKDPALAEAELAARDSRWEHVVNAFSHIDHLHEDRLASGLLKLKLSDL